jgi:nuclear GTP-binding protein
LFFKSLAGNQSLVQELMESSKGIGAEKLMELIKNYSRNEGVKKSVTVGVIGFPNVGKSSLINTLKKRKAVGVSSIAGYTKHL